MVYNKFIPVLVSLLLGACMANGYQKFYVGVSGELSDYQYFEGQPQLYPTNDFDRDIDQLARRGYFPIGQSAFSGQIENTKNALKQASRVGAEIVLVSSKYVDTVSGSIPWQSPTTTTSTTNVYGSTQGTIGTTPYAGIYTGTGTTTTRGTQTTYIPYSYQRYNQRAIYFSSKRLLLGVVFGPIPNTLRKELSTNKGVFVRIVVNDTPAFFADIFDGDIIMAVNDVAVYSPAELNNLLRRSAGKTVSLEIYRGGARIVKSALLNEIPPD